MPAPNVVPRREPRLDALSDELLISIFRFLFTRDVLSARQTARVLYPAATTVLQDRLTQLYLHPKRSSIERCIAICNHPILSQQITGLILLGYTPRHTVYACWPRVIQGAESGSYADEDHWLEIAYKPLLDALTKLPRLTTLDFSFSWYLPGWNPSKFDTIRQYAQGYAVVRANPDDDHFDRPTGARLDVQILLPMLASPRLQFDRLVLSTEIPIMIHPITRLRMPPQSPELCRAFAHLSNLDITVTLGESWDYVDGQDATNRNDDRWIALCGTIIAHAAPNLTTLRLTFDTTCPEIERPHGHSALYRLLAPRQLCESCHLQQQHFAKLRDLTLHMQLERAHYRAPRPYYQHFHPNSRHLLRLLMPCLTSTLRRVDIDNITLCHDLDPNWTGAIPRESLFNAVEATRRIIQLAQQRPEPFEHFRFVVHRFLHHTDCPCDNNDPIDGRFCRRCGLYSLLDDPNNLDDSCSVGKWEALATELGVSYDLASRSWDFGEVVETAP